MGLPGMQKRNPIKDARPWPQFFFPQDTVLYLKDFECEAAFFVTCPSEGLISKQGVYGKDIHKLVFANKLAYP